MSRQTILWLLLLLLPIRHVMFLHIEGTNEENEENESKMSDRQSLYLKSNHTNIRRLFDLTTNSFHLSCYRTDVIFHVSGANYINVHHKSHKFIIGHILPDVPFFQCTFLLYLRLSGDLDVDSRGPHLLVWTAWKVKHPFQKAITRMTLWE